MDYWNIGWWAASKPSLFHDIQKHFQYGSHFSGIKKKPWAVFLMGWAVYSDSRNLAAYFWRYQINPKDSKRPVSYSLIDVWSGCCWMWWATRARRNGRYRQVDIDNYHDKCHILISFKLKADFCSNVKVVKARDRPILDFTDIAIARLDHTGWYQLINSLF